MGVRKILKILEKQLVNITKLRLNLYILVQYKTIVEIIIHFVIWKPLIMVKMLMAWINTEVVSKYVLVCYIYSTSDGLYLIYNKGAWLLIVR